jgi:hypothetical protein
MEFLGDSKERLKLSNVHGSSTSQAIIPAEVSENSLLGIGLIPIGRP